MGNSPVGTVGLMNDGLWRPLVWRGSIGDWNLRRKIFNWILRHRSHCHLKWGVKQEEHYATYMESTWNLVPLTNSVLDPHASSFRQASCLSELYLADARHHSVNFNKWKQPKQLRQITDPNRLCSFLYFTNVPTESILICQKVRHYNSGTKYKLKLADFQGPHSRVIQFKVPSWNILDSHSLVSAEKGLIVSSHHTQPPASLSCPAG